jgi:hypothetical protein
MAAKTNKSPNKRLNKRPNKKPQIKTVRAPKTRSFGAPLAFQSAAEKIRLDRV